MYRIRAIKNSSSKIALLVALMSQPISGAVAASYMSIFGTDNPGLVAPVASPQPEDAQCGHTVLSASGNDISCGMAPAALATPFRAAPSSGDLAERIDFKPYLTLRGGYQKSSLDGEDFLFDSETGFDADFYSGLGEFTFSSKILFANELGEDIALTGFNNVVNGRFELSRSTDIDLAASLNIVRTSIDDNLPANTAVAPISGTASISGTLNQRFGYLSVSPNFKIERVVYGKTVLEGGAKLSNDQRQYWRGHVGLGGSFELSPRFALVSNVFVNRTWYDLQDVNTDFVKVGLRLGFEASWSPQLLVDGGVTASVDHYMDGSGHDGPNWLLDGAVAYRPNDEARFSAALTGQSGPSDVVGAKSQIERTLELAASYQANQALTLRASLSGTHTSYSGLSGTATSVELGAGLDYALSEYVTGTLDLGAIWVRDESDVLGTDQSLMVGVTVRP